jgi:hypothetical protein
MRSDPNEERPIEASQDTPETAAVRARLQGVLNRMRSNA